jgi:hypothetical protein
VAGVPERDHLRIWAECPLLSADSIGGCNT